MNNRFVNSVYGQNDGMGIVAVFDSFKELYKFITSLDNKFKDKIEKIDYLLAINQYISNFLSKQVIKYLEKTYS